jgi:CRISPR/Cas system-associated exonuclease Cas4 (RecB family)
LILEEYPHLTEEKVRAALSYAYENMDELQQEIKEAQEAYEKGDPIPPKKAQA